MGLFVYIAIIMTAYPHRKNISEVYTPTVINHLRPHSDQHPDRQGEHMKKPKNKHSIHSTTLIHAANMAWIGQIAFIFITHESPPNLLTQPFLIGAILTAIALHLLRWQMVGTEEANLCALDDESLKKLLSDTVDAYFGKTPYLIAPKLQANLLQERITQMRETLSRTDPPVSRSLIFTMIFDFPKAKMVFLFGVLVAMLALGTGGLRTDPFGGNIGSLISFFLLCVLIGLAIYSSATLINLGINKKGK
jgi:hypothetical protein